MRTGILLRLGEDGADAAAVVQYIGYQLGVLGEQVHHELRGSAQQAGDAEGALIGASHDEDMVADGLDQTLGGLEPDAETSRAHRIGNRHVIDVAQVLEHGLLLVHDGGFVVAEDHLGAYGLGNGRVVEVDHAAVVSVFLLRDDVGLGHLAAVAVHLADLVSGRLDREHETLRHDGKRVGHPPVQHGHAAFQRCHFFHIG